MTNPKNNPLELFYSEALAIREGGDHQVRAFYIDQRDRFIDVLKPSPHSTGGSIVEVKILSSSGSSRVSEQVREYSLCKLADGTPLDGYSLRIHFVITSEADKALIAQKQLENPDITYTYEPALELTPVTWRLADQDLDLNGLRRLAKRIIHYWPDHVQTDELLTICNLGKTDYRSVERRNGRLFAVKATGKRIAIIKAVEAATGQTKQQKIAELYKRARIQLSLSSQFSHTTTQKVSP